MSKKSIVMIIIVAIIALIIGMKISHYYFGQKNIPQTSSSTLYSPPQPISAFSLVDTKGRPFNNYSLEGRWTFLFFGFTSCPQICPTAMADLNKMYAILLQQEQNPMPQVVLVSVDPANDTLEKLGNYVASYNPHFQGATGDKAEIDKLAASLNILVTQTPMGQKVGAQAIDHSGAILLIDPTGKLIAVFSLPHDPAAMARDFELIVKNSG